MSHTITPRMIKNAKLAIKDSGTSLRAWCLGMNIKYWTMVKRLAEERKKQKEIQQ